MQSAASSPFLRAGSGGPARPDPPCPVVSFPPKPHDPLHLPFHPRRGAEQRLPAARVLSRYARLRAKAAGHPIHRFKGPRPSQRPVQTKEKVKRRRFVSNPSRGSPASGLGNRLVFSAGVARLSREVVDQRWRAAEGMNSCRSAPGMRHDYSGSPGRVQELRGRCPYPTYRNGPGGSKGHSRSFLTRSIRKIPTTAMTMLRTKARSY